MRPALLFKRKKTGKIFSFFLQFLGILAKCYARNSCLYLLDHKYEKKNSDVSSPLRTLNEDGNHKLNVCKVWIWKTLD